jgi:hypothetical protein
LAEEEPDREEQMLRQLEEELKKVKVSDLLVQTLYTVSSLGYSRLGTEHRDLEQAKLAIEAMRALVPVLEGSVPAEVVSEFNQVTANMQLAYAKAVSDVSRRDEAEAGADAGGADDG